MNFFWRKPHAFWSALCFFAICSIGEEAQAQALNDKDIRAFYNLADVNFYDKDKSLALMKDRLDPAFIIKYKETVKSGDKRQWQHSGTYSKEEIIEKARENYDKGKRTGYKRAIKEILYSEIRRQAYVQYTVQYNGVRQVKDKKYDFPTYSTSRTCYDTLMLKENKITITQTMCDSLWVSPAPATAKGNK